MGIKKLFYPFSISKFLAVTTITVLSIMFYPYLNLQNIKAFIKESGIVAPLLFITICTIKPILLFLPSMGLTIVAGILFGAVWGTIYVAIGGALSTLVGFYFARWLGRDTVKKLIEKSKLICEFEKKSREYGGNAVLYMRLFNMPWDMVSYWAGLSGIRFKDFYIASLIPLLPISFLYTYFGSKVFTPMSAGFIISLIIIFALGAVPYIRTEWKKRRNG